jgi:hypothetical protein
VTAEVKGLVSFSVDVTARVHVMAVVAQHDVPQAWYPALHVKLHAVPLHASTPFAGGPGQLSHAPPQQTWPMVPHEVRFAALPLATHIDCPVSQLVAPVWHALPSMHAVPAVHASHEPLLQTSFDPHAVPFGTLVPVSMHVAVAPEHMSVPVWQGLVGGHDAPALQPPHMPPVQTWPGPQEVPLGALVPVSVQTATPVEQETIPVWQALVGWHAPPWAHGTHAPLSQTSWVPHELPLGSIVPVSVHVDVLPVQSRVPTWQRFAGVHGAPAVHARHVPLSQALPVPQGVPLLAGLPVSAQTA